MSDATEIPDQREVWKKRLARVRRSQARTDIEDLQRPPRDPAERAFLAERGLLGPFEEDDQLPPPSIARKAPRGSSQSG